MGENVVICTIGGRLGVAVALLTLQFSGLALGAKGVMIIIGFVAGVIPAWQAARADIVTALRFA
jgi:ABC-type antimicrobial peptide transport system permease subunit